MCCLFGIIDYGKSLSVRQRTNLLTALSKECEARGTDATGIAYTAGNHIDELDDPAIAFEIALKCVEHFLYDYQLIFVVHEDADHINVHFVMNSVGFNGERYYGKGYEHYSFMEHI